MQKLLDAVRELLADIDEARMVRMDKKPNYFGHFDIFDTDANEEVAIEWPNLAITADKVRALLDAQTDTVRALLADIDVMRRDDPPYVAEEPEDEAGAALKDHWFGAFGVGQEDRQTGDYSVQWPNLSITARKLRALLGDA